MTEKALTLDQAYDIAQSFSGMRYFTIRQQQIRELRGFYNEAEALRQTPVRKCRRQIAARNAAINETR